jgi:hypothetical protein
MSPALRTRACWPALLVVTATILSCAGRSEVVCSTPVPISTASIGAVQARAEAVLRARGYAFYPAAEQMRRIERYDLPLRTRYESLVYAERDVQGVCALGAVGCQTVGVVIVYIVRDEGDNATGWHAFVRAYTSWRSSALDDFHLVRVTGDVQADADAVVQELRLAPGDVIS